LHFTCCDLHEKVFKPGAFSAEFQDAKSASNESAQKLDLSVVVA